MLPLNVSWRSLIPVRTVPSPFSCPGLASSTSLVPTSSPSSQSRQLFANDHTTRKTRREFQSFRDSIPLTFTMVSPSAVAVRATSSALAPFFSTPRCLASPCPVLRGTHHGKFTGRIKLTQTHQQADSLTEEQVSEFKEAFSLFVSQYANHDSAPRNVANPSRLVYRIRMAMVRNPPLCLHHTGPCRDDCAYARASMLYVTFDTAQTMSAGLDTYRINVLRQLYRTNHDQGARHSHAIAGSEPVRV